MHDSPFSAALPLTERFGGRALPVPPGMPARLHQGAAGRASTDSLSRGRLLLLLHAAVEPCSRQPRLSPPGLAALGSNLQQA